MLKITKTQESTSKVSLMLEGKVADQWAALLDGVCRTHLRAKKSVQLDCAHVDFIDAAGVEVLNKFPRSRVTLLHAPDFIHQLLQPKIGDRS